MIRISVLLLWLLAFFGNKSSAQSSIDSLVLKLSQTASTDTLYADILNEIGWYYSNSNNDSLRIYSSEALKASRRIGYLRGQAYAYRGLGVTYIPLSRYDSARLYFDSAFMALDQSEDRLLRSDVHNAMGITYEESGNFGQALNQYFLSIALKTQTNDSIGIGKIHNNIGKAYYSLGVYDSATTYLIKSLENEAYVNLPSRGSWALMNLASVKTSLGEFEEAKDLFQESLRIKTELGEQVPIATINGWLGEINLLTGNIDEAKRYYLLSLNQFDELKHIKGAAALRAKVGEVYMKKQLYDSALLFFKSGLIDKNWIEDKQDVPGLLVNMAKSYEGLGNTSKALTTAREAIDRAKAINSKSEILEGYEFLHQVYAKTGQISKAYNALQNYITYKDSVINEQKLKEIKTLETVYGVKQLQQEKVQLEQEKQTQDLIYSAELRRQNIIKYSSIGGLVLVMLLALNYYRSNLRKKKANRLLQQKNLLITSQKEFLEEQSTELKRINEQLEELSSFKEGLTHMIAHDMKNPLHVIISLAEGKVDAGNLKTISQSGRDMLNLVTNMLDIQKFDEARMELKKVDIPVSKLISESLLQTELLFASKGLKYQIGIEEGSFLSGDKSLLERVLVNLLTNAVKYSSVGGTIRLTSKLLNDKVQLQISDEGSGIAPSDMDNIFDKFWQGEARATGKAASTGIGLTFCKLAIEAHGGSIDVKSELKKGTTFIINLPQGEKTSTATESDISHSGSQNLTSDDLSHIGEYLPSLKQLKVHQISQIKSIIQEIEENHRVTFWSKQVKACVFNGDQEKYDLLVSEPMSKV